MTTEAILITPDVRQAAPVRGPDAALLEQFCDTVWLEDGLATTTMHGYRLDVELFARWWAATGRQAALLDAAKEDVAAYMAYLFERGNSTPAVRRTLASLRRLFRWAAKEKLTRQDPLRHLATPKLPPRLPRALSEKDIDTLLQGAALDQPHGIRNKAMLELAYASGLRVTELTTLTLHQIDLAVGLVRVTGKGDKERITPVGEAAVDWVARYLKDVRPRLVRADAPSDYLFLTRLGQPMTRQHFWRVVREVAQARGILTPVYPHVLRHSFATHLMNHGADLRALQMLMGHADITTTQVYTHVATDRVKQIHREHHPRG